MKVLLFGNGDSIWIKSVIQHTFLKYNDDVTVMSIEPIIKYKEYYHNNSIRIIPYKKWHGKVGSIISPFFNIIGLTEKYDICCIHYVGKTGMLVSLFAKLCSKKLILCYWGSDLLRISKRNILSILSLKRSDSITVTTQEMNDKFHQLYGNTYDYKIRRVLFGSNGIEIIKERIFDKKQIYKKYNIDSKKIVLTIGYNRMKEQQHLKILDVVKQLSNEDRKKIHLLLKLTYGNGGEDYVNEIKHLAVQTGCTFNIFESYLSDDEVAELTVITDIFVQGQITDARSASMCEHLFSSSLVINPSWLSYSELKNDIFFLEYESFTELGKILSCNLEKKENSQYKEKLERNNKEIYNYCSWESFVPGWRDVYID